MARVAGASDGGEEDVAHARLHGGVDRSGVLGQPVVGADADDQQPFHTVEGLDQRVRFVEVGMASAHAQVGALVRGAGQRQDAGGVGALDEMADG